MTAPTPPPSEVEALGRLIHEDGVRHTEWLDEAESIAEGVLSAGYIPPSRVEALRREIAEARAAYRDAIEAGKVDTSAEATRVGALIRALALIEGKP